MTTILVCGGRDFGYFEDIDRFKEPEKYIQKVKECCFVISWLSKMDRITPIDVMINGYANGVDKIADQWAVVNRKTPKRYPAKWKEHSKAAGPIRNQQMLDEEPNIDFVIAFPGGNGTADMVKRAKLAGIEVIEVKYNDFK